MKWKIIISAHLHHGRYIYGHFRISVQYTFPRWSKRIFKIQLSIHVIKKKKSFLHYYCCRYQWNGSPLLISQPKDGKLAVENCSSCGGTLVFELQLVPPLLQFLRFPGQSGQIIYLHFLITMLITTIFYTFCMVMSIRTHRCKWYLNFKLYVSCFSHCLCISRDI